MRCTSVQPDLPDYLADILPESRSRDIREHMQGCPACRGIAEELRPVFDMLVTERKWKRPVMTDSSFIVAVNEKIDAQNRRRQPGPLFIMLGIPAIAATVTIALLILLLPAREGTDSAAFSTVEIANIINSMDTIQIQALHDELASAANLTGIASSSGMLLTSNGDASFDLATVLVEEMSYSELVAAGSRYLADDDLLALMTPDAVEALSPSGIDK